MCTHPKITDLRQIDAQAVDPKYHRLASSGIKIMPWEKENHILFWISKNVAILLSYINVIGQLWFVLWMIDCEAALQKRSFYSIFATTLSVQQLDLINHQIADLYKP